jgi:hypothetical protein
MIVGRLKMTGSRVGETPTAAERDLAKVDFRSRRLIGLRFMDSPGPKRKSNAETIKSPAVRGLVCVVEGWGRKRRDLLGA